MTPQVNPLGTKSSVDKVSLYPYFYVKGLIRWVFLQYLFPYLYANPQSHKGSDRGVHACAVRTGDGSDRDAAPNFISVKLKVATVIAPWARSLLIHAVWR